MGGADTGEEEAKDEAGVDRFDEAGMGIGMGWLSAVLMEREKGEVTGFDAPIATGSDDSGTADEGSPESEGEEEWEEAMVGGVDGDSDDWASAAVRALVVGVGREV